jgi:diguanylate cyclase (GGDEF)-like protein
MTSEINRIDAERSERSIAAALDTFVHQLADQVSDEAVWTEAFLNTYGRLNPAWLDSTWGATARADGHYDAVAVTDADGRILFGESVRGPLRGELGDHYGAVPQMLAALAGAVADEGDDAVIGRYARREGSPAAIAAAVIHGQSSQLAIPPADRRILWLAKRIDDTMLNDIAQRFHVPVPRLAGAAALTGANRTHTLRDAAGEAVAAVSWRPLRPGDAAFVHAASSAALLLAILAALIFAVLSAFRRSVVKRAESEERDWRNARYDRSTGLVNRLGLEEVIASEFSRQVSQIEIGLACAEFDGLKDISGSYGEETAEHLLDRLAHLIDAALDGQARIARIGPDQFALCCTGPGSARSIRAYCGIVIELVAEAIALDDLRLKVRATIGIAEAMVTRDTIGATFVMAGTALQRARETGEHIVAYDPSLEDSRERRLAMQADIRRGLDAGEFDLAYQPIFNFSTQTMLGAEALLRWPRRAGGVLSPSEFIPVAEASGLIEDLGLFALRRACEDIAPLPDIKISVNISTVQLRSPTLSSRIGSILKSTNFPPERLQLEITESFLLAQPERAKATIEELRARGITLALDDFGTGFSSVGYLRQFSFDRVKLDRSLVDHIDDDPVKLALVESTMIYAFAMGLSVTAEGVERKEEATTLMRLGCREFQGYLLSRPLGLVELTRLLNRSRDLRQAS